MPVAGLPVKNTQKSRPAGKEQGGFGIMLWHSLNAYWLPGRNFQEVIDPTVTCQAIDGEHDRETDEQIKNYTRYEAQQAGDQQIGN